MLSHWSTTTQQLRHHYQTHRILITTRHCSFLGFRIAVPQHNTSRDFPFSGEDLICFPYFSLVCSGGRNEYVVVYINSSFLFLFFISFYLFIVARFGFFYLFLFSYFFIYLIIFNLLFLFFLITIIIIFIFACCLFLISSNKVN